MLGVDVDDATLAPLLDVVVDDTTLAPLLDVDGDGGDVCAFIWLENYILQSPVTK